ncbi:MAG: helix-turn-helix transcriptional regulator [Bacteroidales bacterium]|jgi:transcriptional regulator with XRE-family HTH domain|nr:helix-turn-helix transcriptional regulator [Bacteroidales bacterium]
MKNRVIQFLSRENKTSAQFAEEIGVQPSGVSHILSGRNNPSLDFVLKMLKRYSFISPEWLLFGNEPMYRANVNPTLFDEDIMDNDSSENVTGNNRPADTVEVLHTGKEDVVTDNVPVSKLAGKVPAGKISRVILFYEDRKFEEYYPE